jgi:hypothetical protein
MSSPSAAVKNDAAENRSSPVVDIRAHDHDVSLPPPPPLKLPVDAQAIADAFRRWHTLAKKKADVDRLLSNPASIAT